MEFKPQKRRPPMGGGHGGMMAPGEKAKDGKKALGYLLKYSNKYAIAFGFVLLLAIAGAVLSIIGPNYIKRITNIILEGAMPYSGGINLKAATRLCIILVVCYSLSVLFQYAQAFIMATVTQRLCKRLRGDISCKINRMPLRYFDSNSFGDTLSRATNDVDLIEMTLNRSVGSLVIAVTQFIGSIIMMFYTNPIMAAAAIGTTIVGFLSMTLIITKSQKYFLRQQRQLGEINGQIEEIYSGHNVVKAYSGEKSEAEKFETLNKKLQSSTWKAQFFSGIMMPLMSFVGNLGYVAVCIVGGAMAIKGKINFGVVVAFMLYVDLFTSPLTQFATAASSLQSATAASERVFEFLHAEELEDESNKTAVLETAKGDVVFDHVRFGYDKDKVIIKDFSAHALPGQKIAIVGPTGAGKTTLVNLLMRFYELDGGKILVDGVDIATLRRKNVRDLFGMVLQDTWLFSGTIKENIAYGKENVTDEEIEAAAKAVGLDHFIHTLPKGYNAVLDSKVNLSVGQRQLMTIARAIVENAPLLILDEATSSVDTRTEELIQRSMDSLTHGRTSFVIAHRLSTIKNADLILVLDQGDVVESGTHEELLAKGGVYSNLYNSQFNNVVVEQ